MRPETEEQRQEILSLAAELADGIIGAAAVLRDMLAFCSDVGLLRAAKDLNLKGSRLWVLYKDVCKEQIAPVAMLLAAYGDGNITKDQVDRYMNPLMRARDKELAEEMYDKVVIPTAIAMVEDVVKQKTW